MLPEFHRQMMSQRTAELRKAADEHRLAREARKANEKAAKNGSGGERRRGLFSRIIPA
ncbi:hypothetical protein [Streptosporangium sp. NPDC004631]